MSYDVSLEISTGKEMQEIVDIGNYTSNVSPMWAKALQAADDGIGLGITRLRDLHEQEAGAMVELLQRAVADMEARPEEYKQLNPENRWGDYTGALAYLRNILAACEQHPACTIYVSH